MTATSNYGPPTDPEVRARMQKELDERNAAIDETMANCPNCKIAKTLTRKNAPLRLTTEQLNYRVERAGCKRHKDMHRLNYVTSPLSETYWTS